MPDGQTTSPEGPHPSGSTGPPDSAKVDLERVEVITPEAIDYAEELILRTLREMAAEYQAKQKKT